MTDHLRAFTLTLDASESAVDIERAVELCPGARVYALDIATTCANSVGAVLELQDSRYVIPAGETNVFMHQFPGLRWPAFARLIARAGSVVTLHVFYGNCGPV